MAEKVFSQGELEVIAAALGDTSEGLTGSEIGHLLASIKMIDPTPTSTKSVPLHNAFVERQNRAQNRRAILNSCASRAAGVSCKAACQHICRQPFRDAVGRLHSGRANPRLDTTPAQRICTTERQRHT